MNRVQVLDCTLRDGGYVNLWKFGYKKIQDIIDGLIKANIDYIECGYLKSNVNELDYDVTLFKNETQLKNVIKEHKKIKKLVAMIDFGQYNLAELNYIQSSFLFGIRLAFHKQDSKNIETSCKIIKEKGYHLFLQPIVTVNYTDEELLELIDFTNKIEPYAFYIVDSFGSLKKNDLQRMLYLIDNNLKQNVILGFHSHNNLQMAYSNAQVVTQLQTNRKIIIDSSIFGMGRGAGNLNTELFVEYLNDCYCGNYNLKPLLKVMDNTLNRIYSEKYWGYSLAHYLSAIYNCHPNYATYFSEKNSLFSDDIENIISQIDDMHKEQFTEVYAEKLYLSYLSIQKGKNYVFENLAELYKDKEVLMLGPGKSSLEQREQIDKLVTSDDIITVSINCICEWLGDKIDYIFVSNKRRFETIPFELYSKLILTTNIECDETLYKVDYENLLNYQKEVEDNAGMMFIKLLIILKVKKVYIAGLDGFSLDMDDNYFDEKLKFSLNKHRMQIINKGLKKLIVEYRNLIEIEFVKEPKFLTEDL
jgi:4-hydroxy 2-oxovalerate aldolase